MNAQPEPKPEPESSEESVTWIGRGHGPLPPQDTPTRKRYGLPESLRTKPRLWAAGLIAVLAIAIAAVWSNRASDTAVPGAVAASEQALPLVSVTTPGLSAVSATVTFTGAIAARYDMPISIEGDAGRIVSVLVEAGDRVKKGQLLAQLDTSVLRPQVARLAAALEEARAQAALSAATYRRALGVEAAGALSAEEIERRRAASVTDEARVKVAEAQLAEAQARLARTEIRAPADGLVLTRTAEVGQTANPGEPLFRLAAGGEVEMRGLVAEQDLAQLKVGQPASVRITGVAEPFQGTVRLLGAIIDPQTRLGEIRIALKPDPALRPGAFARGEVVVDNAQRPVLPQTAVLSDENGTYVLIVNEKNEVERRPVRVATTLAEGVVIGEGLKGDERVVATAGAFLRVGEKVAVAEHQAKTT